MSYIIANAIYPSDKQNAVKEIYLSQVKNNPPNYENIDTIIPLAVNRTHDGINTMIVTKAKPGRLEEALADVRKRVFGYNEIPGYECKIEVWATMEEAFAVAGIPMPR